MKPFDGVAWSRKKSRDKLKALVLGIIAFINLIDLNYPLPIPLTGMTALIATAILGMIAGYFAYRGYAPPTSQEILMLADKYEGYLTLAVVQRELDLPIDTIERLLVQYYQKGYLQPVQKGRDEPVASIPIAELVFRFVGVAEKTPDIVEEGSANEVPVSDVQAINRALLGGTMRVQGGLPTVDPDKIE